MLRLTDLREILHYVPGFRDQLFVIAVDGEIVDDDNFHNLLLDVALLRSLNIQVVLVHGISHQLRRLADERGVALSSDDGTGVTDEKTFQLAQTVAHRVTSSILARLASVDLHGASINAVVAHPAGILKGVDMQNTGRVERIEVAPLRTLLGNGIVPVFPPLGFDGAGHTYRVNSDQLAHEIAVSLDAVKILYVTPRDGIELDGKLLRQLTVTEAERTLQDRRQQLVPAMVTKLEHACLSCRRGVDRIHFVNGRIEEGLLAEIFSNEGIGTLVYDGHYEVIRPATEQDAANILKLIHKASLNDEVLPKTVEEIEADINCYVLLEIDSNPVACAALIPYPDEEKAELASLVVSSGHENYGIGRRLIDHVEHRARQLGVKELLCLSTQAYTYFEQQAAFQQASPSDLPPNRFALWEGNGRNSRVLKKTL